LLESEFSSFYRDVEAFLAGRGILANHVTFWQWDFGANLIALKNRQATA
jgi:hypothetical protein